HVVREPFRTRVVGHAGIQQRFDDRVAAAEDVADDHAVEIVVQLAFVVPLVQPDPELAQLGAHRRVDVLVGTGHLVAGCLRKGRDAAHEGAANSEDMNPHQVVTGKSASRNAIEVSTYTSMIPTPTT